MANGGDKKDKQKARIRRGKINPKRISGHRNCVLRQAKQEHDALVKYLRKALPDLEKAEAMVRFGDFIKKIGQSGSMAKSAWDDCLEKDSAGQTRFWSMESGWRATRDSQKKKIDDRVKKYLNETMEKKVRPDLEKHDLASRFWWFAKLTEGVTGVPVDSLKKWFDDQIYPALFPKSQSAWAKVLTFGVVKEFWPAYTDVIARLSPLIVYKVEMAAASGVSVATRILEHLLGTKSTPKFLRVAGKRVSTHFTLGKLKVRWQNVLNLRSGDITVQARGGATIRQFNINDHVLHVQAISGLLAAIGWVLTLYDLKKNPTVSSWMKSGAGAAGMIGSFSKYMETRVLRTKTLLELPTKGSAGLRVPVWSTGAKLLGTAASLLGVWSAGLDTRDMLFNADYDAAAFGGVGMAGAILMCTGVAPLMIAGVILTIAGAIGTALCADSELEKWIKRTPYGSATVSGTKGYGRYTVGQYKPCEKDLEAILKGLRQKRARELHAKALKMESQAQAKRAEATKLRNEVQQAQAAAAYAQNRPLPGGVPQQPAAVQQKLDRAYQLEGEAAKIERTVMDCRLNAHLLMYS